MQIRHNRHTHHTPPPIRSLVSSKPANHTPSCNATAKFKPADSGDAGPIKRKVTILISQWEGVLVEAPALPVVNSN
ncbi:hypothetical protein E2C01_091738 [Portunus trituberculatus]|uniref:Uncharacterized protein n=1 Tax=Portunus trituberculatus TaxID=210409 RepID=A0A5B7JQ67_PORTR|nr:hypothetical protein [Portunus trituberculatus]